MVEWFACTTCGEERPFDRPECLDGHGADCPERCCAYCGEAILVESFEVAVEVELRTAA